MSSGGNSYFGSVRFFKNLILLIVIIAIATPTVVSILRGRELTALRADLATQAAKPDPGDLPPVDQPSVDEESVSDPIGEPPVYQSMFPDFYSPAPLTADTTSDKTIYLTFDDGPSQNTYEILEILEEEDVKATFFVVGHDSETARQQMQAIVEAGHTIGMHTYSHDYDYIYASVENYLEDMYRLFNLILDATGTTPTVFRFPGGSINGYNFGMSQELLAEMLRRGFVPYDWNLSAEDSVTGTISAQRVLNNVVNSASRVNRGFVLMHDSPSAATTPDALRPMIQELRDMGFSFAPITEQVKPVLFNYQY